MHRIGSQHAQGVDLLGDAHRPQLGGHRAANAAGQHRRRQHRPQLLDQRDVDHGPQVRFQVHESELVIRLHRHDHADKATGHHHHRQALDPDLIHAREQYCLARQPRHEPGQELQKEQRQPPQGGNSVESQFADVFDRSFALACQAVEPDRVAVHPAVDPLIAVKFSMSGRFCGANGRERI